MSEITKEKARELINQHMKQIEALFGECEQLADKHDVAFSFDYIGYGAGATYYPNKKDEEHEDGSGWMPSSQSCF